ncbi:MAG: hypothetical protein RL379_241 [Bacillota bacterium]|jgi:predicted RNA-binding protein YlxR (DUF448 family)
MNITKKKNSIPLRRCMVTGEQLPKSALIRLVKTPDQKLEIDLTLTGKLNGRGAYLKKDPSLMDALRKGRFIQKNLKIEPDDSFYAKLQTILHG